MQTKLGFDKRVAEFVFAQAKQCALEQGNGLTAANRAQYAAFSAGWASGVLAGQIGKAGRIGFDFSQYAFGLGTNQSGLVAAFGLEQDVVGFDLFFFNKAGLVVCVELAAGGFIGGFDRHFDRQQRADQIVVGFAENPGGLGTLEQQFAQNQRLGGARAGRRVAGDAAFLLRSWLR